MKNQPSKSTLNYLQGKPQKPWVNPFEYSPKKAPPFEKSTSAALPDCPPCGPFPLDAFPAVVRAKVENLSSNSSLPLPMIALAALAIISAAIGRSFLTKTSNRTGPTLCNLIVILSSPTASGKSIINHLLQAKLRHERELKAESERASPSHQLEADLCHRKYLSIQKEILNKETKGTDSTALREIAEALVAEKIKRLKLANHRPALCLRNPTGAALRDQLSLGDQTCFLFSLDGSSSLSDIFSGKDSLLKRLMLSGFSGEDTGAETATSGSLGGEICIAALYALQPEILRSLLFNKKASHEGLLNRPIIIDKESLPADLAISPHKTDPAAATFWDEMINNLLEHRLNSKEAITFEWCPDSVSIFETWEKEVEAVLKKHPESAREHSGRTTEIAVKIAGTLLAIDYAFHKVDCANTQRQTAIAKSAVNIMRWLFRHRLQIQSGAFKSYIATQAQALESILKRKGGSLSVSLVKDCHPQIHKDLDSILAHYPERFRQIKQRKGSTGPLAPTIILNE